jgi:hypothetical protein
LATFLCAIFAVALIFTACKKEDDKAPAAPNKSMAVNCINEGFDPEASYTTRGNGADGWNQVQDFIPGGHHTTYNFWLENTAGETFVSFCGGFSSSGLGIVEQDLTLEFDQRFDIIGVLNYINNEYGSIDAWSGNQGTITNTEPAANTKLIAQYAIWSILGQTVTSNVPAIDDAVLDVLANGKTASGDIDIYFLVGANFPTDIDGIQPQIVPYCGGGGIELFGGISFQKMKLINGEEEFAEEGEFAFDLFKEVNGQYTEKIGTYTTDGMAMVSVFGLESGNYVFIEVASNDWKLNLPAGINGLYFTIDGNIATWRDAFMVNNNTVVNIPNKKLGPAYGSVTATQKGNVPNIIASLNPKNGNPQDPQSFNAGVVYGSNHFCYAAFTRAELEAGVELDFVVGNKFQIVGSGTAQIVGGNIVVTIDNFGKGSFGVMAFNQNMVTKKFPKNGNIHSQKEADLKKELGATTGFNHDNKLVVPCPAGNTIYLYIHCGTIQFFQ